MYAFDTETVNGQPYLFQWCGPDQETVRSWRVNKGTILDRFFSCLEQAGQAHQVNILWAHHLEFDLGVVFLQYPEIWGVTRYYGQASVNGVQVRVSLHHYLNPFHVIQVGGKRWLLVDTMSWYRMSLEGAASRLQLAISKLSRPRYLGRRVPCPGRETELFRAYAERDAQVTWALGKHIVERHKDFGIKLTISIAQMAATIFRHRFLGEPEEGRRVSWQSMKTHGKVYRVPLVDREDRTIPFPEMRPGSNILLRASLLSYHGGKNGLYVNPGTYERVSEVDIVSAYPHAMWSLPGLTQGRWQQVRTWQGSERIGVYQINGVIPVRCPYGVFFENDSTQKICEGTFCRVWTTSFEVQAAMDVGDLSPVGRCFGFVWEPTAEAINPFRAYVEHFFMLKQEIGGADPKRETYKLLLNALYGKLIQRNEEPDPILGMAVVKAGGLFNPFLASLITGHCRAQLHRYEHQYQALHSSTDSFLTQTSVDQIPTGAGLGELEIKATGTLTVLRNKLYLLYGADGRLLKAALHGFRGTPRQLERLIRKGGGSYSIQHMWRPREARRIGEIPFSMATRRYTLKGVWDHGETRQEEGLGERGNEEGEMGEGVHGEDGRVETETGRGGD